MSPDWMIPFGLILFGLGMFAGALLRGFEARERARLGISCPHCHTVTRLRHSAGYPNVILCEHCDRSIGREGFFDR